VLALSRRYIPLRVEAKAAFMQVFDAARAASHALGEQLAAEGTLASADDVAYLTIPELVDGLPADVAATVAERRARREAYLRTDLPLEGGGMPEPCPLADGPGGGTGGGTAGDGSGDGGATDDRGLVELTALGASGGKVEGIARVLVDPSDPDALEPGDVLVCHTTDPSWSSHFFVASAVVIDIGGTLSHGAIVARELGIPCVIGTTNGSRLIRSGDRVAVDGDAGTVAVLERAP
jgi:pyruvate,water dikinase